MEYVMHDSETNFNLRKLYLDEFGQNPPITYDHFQELITTYLKHMGEQCDEQSAARIIISKYKVVPYTSIDISEIGKYANKNVAVKGVIMYISDVKTYRMKSGEEGNYKVIKLASPSGDLWVSFWDEIMEVLEDYAVGDCVEVKGFVKNLNSLKKSHLEGYRLDCKFIDLTEEIQIPYITLDEIHLNSDVKLLMRPVELKTEQKVHGEVLTLYTYLIEDTGGMITVSSWKNLDLELDKVYEAKGLQVISWDKGNTLALKTLARSKFELSKSKIITKKSTYYATSLTNLRIGILHNYNLVLSGIRVFSYVKQGASKAARRLIFKDDDDTEVVLVDWDNTYSKITEENLNSRIKLYAFYLVKADETASVSLGLKKTIFSKYHVV